MNLGLSIEIGLEQRLSHGPHSPIKNPRLTKRAEDKMYDTTNSRDMIDRILSKTGVVKNKNKMLMIEALLLSLWDNRDEWKQYLDSPLIAHVDAALSLKNNCKYDAVVGVKDAGIPYANIFKIIGMPSFEIDYSHHKRGMEKPEIEQDTLKSLKDKKRVLIADVDMVTGKTLRTVAEFLRANGINVSGAYIGLYRWPGIKTEKSYIGADTVDFEKVWSKDRGGLSHSHKILYKKGMIPSYLHLCTSNRHLDKNEMHGAAAARRIADYFKGRII